MKYALCFMKISAMVAFFILMNGSVAQCQERYRYQTNEGNSNCPRGTRCVENSRCRPSLLSPVRRPPTECGHSYNFEKKICCSQRRIRTLPTYSKTRNPSPAYNNKRNPDPTYNSKNPESRYNSRNPYPRNNNRNPNTTNNHWNSDSAYNNKRIPDPIYNNRIPDLRKNNMKPDTTNNHENPDLTNYNRNPDLANNNSNPDSTNIKRNLYPTNINRNFDPKNNNKNTEPAINNRNSNPANNNRNPDSKNNNRNSDSTNNNRTSGPTYNHKKNPNPTFITSKNPEPTYSIRRNGPAYNNRGNSPDFSQNNRSNSNPTSVPLKNPAPTANGIRNPKTTSTTSKYPDSECGTVSGQTKSSALTIGTGGKEAKQGDWPWMVAISMRSQDGTFTQHCSGALISRRHVLSAAHCFQETDPAFYLARIGHVDLYLANVYVVSQIDIPEFYNPKQFYGDIAVLTLSKDATSQSAQSICLPKSPEDANSTIKTATSAGWDPGDSPSPNLVEFLDLPVISNRRCNTLFSSRLLSFRRDFPRGITDEIICAGVLRGDNGTCQGDSGGPLMYLHEDHWFVVGVASFGVKCGFLGLPGGYTNVAKYLEWILHRIIT